MLRNNSVTLSSNGKYWQAAYYNVCGQRCAKSLGPKSKLSRRQARVLCDRLAVDLQTQPSKLTQSSVPRLGDYLEMYHKSRTDLADGSKYLQRLTGRYLVKFFGAEIRIDRITRAMASAWRAALANGELKEARTNHQYGTMSETTVCGRVKDAKTIFNSAVRDDLIPFNPFDRLKRTPPDPDRDWEVSDRILDLRNSVDALKHPLKDAQYRPPVSVRSIHGDLLAAEAEFARFTMDPVTGIPSIVTDHVILEEIHLGRFRIEIDPSLIPTQQVLSAVKTIALDPFPAAHDDSVTHPHVRDETPCLGDASLPVVNALREGRLCDTSQLISCMLHSYNGGSAYVPLEEWTGQTCDESAEALRQMNRVVVTAAAAVSVPAVQIPVIAAATAFVQPIFIPCRKNPSVAAVTMKRSLNMRE